MRWLDRKIEMVAARVFKAWSMQANEAIERIRDSNTEWNEEQRLRSEESVRLQKEHISLVKESIEIQREKLNMERNSETSSCNCRHGEKGSKN